MMSLSFLPCGILVTGSSGYIGSGLCEALAQGRGSDSCPSAMVPETSVPGTMGVAGQPAYYRLPADVGRLDELQCLSEQWRPHTVVHLAARGAVVAPRSQIAQMLSVTVEGAVNLLEAFNPRKFILASSCAIYGNTGALAALPTWKRVNPVSVYGVSKAAAELVVGHWAKETGNVAINLRIGNVIGKGCRGLIAYLVRHAVRRPRGFPPAQLRGAGKIVRDYVPRDHVVRVIMAAADTEWEAGTVNTFNVGAGRGLTNREVASVVQKLLRERGYELNIHWDAEPAAGESWAAALNVDSTERRFGIPSPTAEAVYEAIHEATIFCLEESVRAAEGAHSAYSATQALS